MNTQTIAIAVFGALIVLALTMFALERRAVARRRAEGRDVDVSDLIFFGSAAGKANKRDTPQDGS
jgi:hypothetical protein